MKSFLLNSSKYITHNGAIEYDVVQYFLQKYVLTHFLVRTFLLYSGFSLNFLLVLNCTLLVIQKIRLTTTIGQKVILFAHYQYGYLDSHGNQ